MLLASAEPIQPPAPVIKTVFPELPDFSWFTGSRAEKLKLRWVQSSQGSLFYLPQWPQWKALVRMRHPHCEFPVRARKTRSSTATERVKRVAALAPESATRLELPLSAGPAGFASVEDVSPGWSEMRVVFGVQLAVPRHVSRTKTWR